VCAIPKLFHKADTVNLMKLNKTKVIEILRKLNEGKTTYQARKVADKYARKVFQGKLNATKILNDKELEELIIIIQKSIIDRKYKYLF